MIKQYLVMSVFVYLLHFNKISSLRIPTKNTCKNTQAYALIQNGAEKSGIVVE